MAKGKCFDPKAREREKNLSRERDEKLLAAGAGSSNGLFSAFDLSMARILGRRAKRAAKN